MQISYTKMCMHSIRKNFNNKFLHWMEFGLIEMQKLDRVQCGASGERAKWNFIVICFWCSPNCMWLHFIPMNAPLWSSTIDSGAVRLIKSILLELFINGFERSIGRGHSMIQNSVMLVELIKNGIFAFISNVGRTKFCREANRFNLF